MTIGKMRDLFSDIMDDAEVGSYCSGSPEIVKEKMRKSLQSILALAAQLQEVLAE